MNSVLYPPRHSVSVICAGIKEKNPNLAPPPQLLLSFSSTSPQLLLNFSSLLECLPRKPMDSLSLCLRPRASQTLLLPQTLKPIVPRRSPWTNPPGNPAWRPPTTPTDTPDTHNEWKQKDVLAFLSQPGGLQSRRQRHRHHSEKLTKTVWSCIPLIDRRKAFQESFQLVW